MPSRLYVVVAADTGTEQLVMATSAAQAVRHVAAKLFGCAIANPLTVARLMGKGGTVVDATNTAVPEESAA